MDIEIAEGETSVAAHGLAHALEGRGEGLDVEGQTEQGTAHGRGSEVKVLLAEGTAGLDLFIVIIVEQPALVVIDFLPHQPPMLLVEEDVEPRTVALGHKNRGPGSKIGVVVHTVIDVEQHVDARAELLFQFQKKESPE